MTILPDLFNDFEPSIRDTYAAACTDAGVSPKNIKLVLADKSVHRGQFKSEFIATETPEVRITWNGIGSLWACAHGIAKIIRPMFELQRTADPKDDPPKLEITPDIEMGLNLIATSLTIAKKKIEIWFPWAPKPTHEPKNDEDFLGDFLFSGALGWIMRHELAHHTLGHFEKWASLPEANINQEHEADAKATDWLKSHLRADQDRADGERPSTSEMELERRALCMFVGLVWLVQFECIPHAKSTTHPDSPNRLLRMIESLDLAEDSFAYEILSYSIKMLIDPEGDWPKNEENPSAKDAVYDAFIRLNRHVYGQ